MLRAEYSPEFKTKVCNAVRTTSESIVAISRQHKVSDALVHSWLKNDQFNPEGHPDRVARSSVTKKNKKKKKKKKARDALTGDIELLSDIASGKTHVIPLPVDNELQRTIRELQREIDFLRKTTSYFAARYNEEH